MAFRSRAAHTLSSRHTQDGEEWLTKACDGEVLMGQPLPPVTLILRDSFGNSVYPKRSDLLARVRASVLMESEGEPMPNDRLFVWGSKGLKNQ